MNDEGLTVVLTPPQMHWANAAVGNTEAFGWVSSSPIGRGVVRATGQLVQMRRVRVVLKKESVAGKLYYVLTAFPEP